MGRLVEQARGGSDCTHAGTSYQQIVYDPGGGKLALMNGQTLSKAFVPLPGGATAVYTSIGLAYYRHSDHLGSSRLATTPSRSLYSATAYAPFGESYKWVGTTDLSFTGQNQDTVSGLYDFMFRKYSPNQVRWISPDQEGLAAVDPTAPQNWNRYAYVGNRPLNSVDPLGLDGYCVAGMCFTTGWAPYPTGDNGGGYGGGGVGVGIGGVWRPLGPPLSPQMAPREGGGRAAPPPPPPPPPPTTPPPL